MVISKQSTLGQSQTKSILEPVLSGACSYPPPMSEALKTYRARRASVTAIKHLCGSPSLGKAICHGPECPCILLLGMP